MDQAAVFLAGSVLTMMGFVVIAIGLVVINVILHKHWKPVTILSKDSFTMFGNSTHHVQDISTVSPDEYDKLVAYLDELRNPTKVEPGLEKPNGKSK